MPWAAASAASQYDGSHTESVFLVLGYGNTWAGGQATAMRFAGVEVGPALMVSPAGWGLVSEGLEGSCCSAGGLAWPCLSRCSPRSDYPHPARCRRMRACQLRITRACWAGGRSPIWRLTRPLPRLGRAKMCPHPPWHRTRSVVSSRGRRRQLVQSSDRARRALAIDSAMDSILGVGSRCRAVVMGRVMKKRTRLALRAVAGGGGSPPSPRRYAWPAVWRSAFAPSLVHPHSDRRSPPPCARLAATDPSEPRGDDPSLPMPPSGDPRLDARVCARAHAHLLPSL
eukprot:359990-Chlamydomonas_euryale.AAC.6